MFYLVSVLGTWLFALVFPIYASYKSIELVSPRHLGGTSVEEKARREVELEGWVIYWIVIGVSSILEGFFAWLLWCIPFYSLLRVAFVIWLVMPQTKGSTYIYITVLSPFLSKHETDIDHVIASLTSSASSALSSVVSGIWSIVADLFWTALRNSDDGRTTPLASKDDGSSFDPSGPPFPLASRQGAQHGEAMMTYASSLWRTVAPVLAVGAQTAAQRVEALRSHDKQFLQTPPVYVPRQMSKEERARQRAALKMQLQALETPSTPSASDEDGSYINVSSRDGSRPSSPIKQQSHWFEPQRSPALTPSSQKSSSFNWFGGAKGNATPKADAKKAR